MKYATLFLTACIILTLTGCGDMKLSSGENTVYSALSGQTSTVSDFDNSNDQSYVPKALQNRTLEDVNLWEYGIQKMTCEEYFSKERYIGGHNTTGYGSIHLGDWNYAFYLQTGFVEEDRVLIYKHKSPIQAAFTADRSVIYFTSENTLYRIFISNGTAEEVYQGDQAFDFWPITNFVTMISYPNPAFKEALDLYGDGMPADHPAQYFYYLYDCRDETLTELHASDFGYEENAFLDRFPAEEIYPLPED